MDGRGSEEEVNIGNRGENDEAKMTGPTSAIVRGCVPKEHLRTDENAKCDE